MIVPVLVHAMLRDMRTPHLGVVTVLPLLEGMVAVLGTPPHLGGRAILISLLAASLL